MYEGQKANNFETEASRIEPATKPADATQAVDVQCRRLRRVCVIQLLTSWIAALLAIYEVETIVGTFLAIFITGLIVVLLARRRTSWLLLCYGLSAFWSIAVVSLTIATFNLHPAEAVPTVPAMLTLYAVLLTWWYFRINSTLKGNREIVLTSHSSMQFSLRGMLLFTTVFCVFSALAKFIPWRSEMKIFGAGGFALLGVSALIMAYFNHSMKSHSRKSLKSIPLSD